MTGKTVCDEFFYSILGANAHYGTPRNPRTPDRVPGGSSSGSAVAAASGAVDFALGSDTGGSVRIPAMANGIYGIRPTHGRVSLAGIAPLAGSFDTVGWPGRRAALLGKIALSCWRKAEPAAVTRIIHAGTLWRWSILALAPPSRALPADAPILPAATGIEIAGAELDAWRETFRVIQAHEAWQAYGAWLDSHDAQLGPGTRERFAHAVTVTGEAVDRARAHMGDIRQPHPRADRAGHGACGAHGTGGGAPACRPRGRNLIPIAPAPWACLYQVWRVAADQHARGQRGRRSHRGFPDRVAGGR
ncbi:MAG: amidase family protein [Alphaproteobacteria bacterium]